MTSALAAILSLRLGIPSRNICGRALNRHQVNCENRQDLYMDMEHHTIFVSTLGRCVRQYADINNRIREREELYMLQSIQLKNKSGCMQQVLQEMEARKENAPLANIKMKQKMEEAEALMSALPQKLAELYDGIQQEMAKKGSLLSEIIQVLKEGNEEMKNVEITAEEEMQKTRITKLETSHQGTGRRQSRHLRNSTATKEPRLAEPSTSKEEDEEEGSEDSESDKPRLKKSKMAKGGRGRPKKAQPVTSTSVPITKPKGKPTDSIVSCEATSTAGAPTLPTPTEEFTSGAFVVSKTDFQNGGDPPIW